MKKTVSIEYIGSETEKYLKINDYSVLSEIIGDIADIGNVIKITCEKADIRLKIDRKG